MPSFGSESLEGGKAHVKRIIRSRSGVASRAMSFLVLQLVLLLICTCVAAETAASHRPVHGAAMQQRHSHARMPEAALVAGEEEEVLLRKRKRHLEEATQAAAPAAGDGKAPEAEYAAFNLNLGIRRAQYTANLVYQRFELWHPRRYLFFLYIHNIPTWGWDILKYKLALKTLLPAAAVATAGGEGSNGNSRPSTSSTSASR